MSSEMLDQMRSIFALCDTEGRGWITPEQLGDAFQLSGEDVKQLCAQLDINQTGQITWDAFINYATSTATSTDTNATTVPDTESLEDKIQRKKQKIRSLKQTQNLQKSQLYEVQTKNIELTEEITKLREALQLEKSQARTAESLKKQLEALRIEQEAQQQKIEQLHESDTRLRSSKASTTQERNELKDKLLEIGQEHERLTLAKEEQDRKLKNALKKAQDRDVLLQEVQELRMSADQAQQQSKVLQQLENQVKLLTKRNSELETLHNQDTQLIESYKKQVHKEND